MTSKEAVELLMEANPPEMLADATMYVDCWQTYQEANANIAANGAIVIHPRTGTPIDNPYVSVRAQALKALRSIKTIRGTNAIWGESVSLSNASKKEAKG